MAKSKRTKCPGHAWRLTSITMISGDGTQSDYVCTQCFAVLHRAPHEPYPVNA